MSETALADRPETGASAREGTRASVMAFVTDDESGDALRRGLEDCLPANGLEVRRGDMQTAIKTLQKIRTPDVLIIDVTSDPRPLTTLGDLSELVEPHVRVLVIGDQDDVEFYRYLTRQLGALEYLHKPLLADNVSRHFGPLIMQKRRSEDSVHGGRIVTITGARGGVGATTLAANLAWHLSVQLRHHTLLMDADMHRGTAAMLLGAETGPGLRVALQAPERIDGLLIERSALPVNDRLHVLAATEELADSHTYVEGAAARLLTALRRRYNYIVLDAAFSPMPFNRALLDLSHQRIIVTEPTLAGVRDTLRMLALPAGSVQSRRAVVVLNRSNAPGALNRQQIEKSLGFAPDIVIPDLARTLESAATLGTPAVAARGPFRKAIVDLASSVGLSAVRRTDKATAKPRRMFGLLR